MSKTKVLITIDVESWIGEYFSKPTRYHPLLEEPVYCMIDGKEWGIGFIMDVLEKYNFKGIFFVETEARYYFGEERIKKVVDSIINRGHEVQLHSHPIFCFFDDRSHKEKRGYFKNYSLAEQEEIIKKSKHFLEKCGVNNILAFRAGGFLANTDTIRAMNNNNILFGSNYNLSMGYDYSLIDENIPRNEPFSVGEVVEFPVTCIQETSIKKAKYKPLQICTVSSKELMNTLEFYFKNNLSFVTLLTHSFEFVTKLNKSNYAGLRPYRLTIKRFESLCRYLSDNKDKAEVVTFGELCARYSIKEIIDLKKTIIYKSSFVDTFSRYLQQIFCR